MKLCYINSRYADPDPVKRRRNLWEARGIARWAEAQGYAVVTWWGSIDPANPPLDTDPEYRRAVLARSGLQARTVGKAGGDIVEATWYATTSGMASDYKAWMDGYGDNVHTRYLAVTWEQVEPYMEAVEEEMIPRAKVQAAVKRIGDCREMAHGNDEYTAFGTAVDVIEEHTGVKPGEGQAEWGDIAVTSINIFTGERVVLCTGIAPVEEENHE